MPVLGDVSTLERCGFVAQQSRVSEARYLVARGPRGVVWAVCRPCGLSCGVGAVWLGGGRNGFIRSIGAGESENAYSI